MPTYADLNTSERILMGPGPSMVHPRVLRAMAQPLVGHLDPQFLELMAEIQELLRFVLQTQNQLTIPVSGTGSASMEAALCNFIEPGDEVVIGVNGYFGERLCDMAGQQLAMYFLIWEWNCSLNLTPVLILKGSTGTEPVSMMLPDELF